MKIGILDYGAGNIQSVVNMFLYLGQEIKIISSKILPLKFGIDKRKPHLSSLIMSNSINKEEALVKLKSSTFGDEFQRIVDKRYFLKK